jgi:hypothetical protein
MSRRKTKNRTGLARIDGIGTKTHNPWVGFICLNCGELTTLPLKDSLLGSRAAYETEAWRCRKCGYIHSKDSPLPFKDWPSAYTDPSSIKCQRFWEAFFRVVSENKEAYWKQCNVCGRVLPSNSFSRHTGWGPLEKQMECRCCKGAINAYLNPKRTKQQLHESSVRRRIGDLLIEGENEKIDIDDLFRRFGGKCFKTKKPLDINDRDSWRIDHILPSSWLYPLEKENAALLSRDANDNKRDVWPSRFYTNTELIDLAKITGADLSLLSKRKPVVNTHIDVDKCVSRVLQVRERSDLSKRIRGLKKLLEDYNLIQRLSKENKRLLGYDKK